ncbi:hypothetical protein JCM8097_008245 [Rhodosporidiobolus ruineniae]
MNSLFTGASRARPTINLGGNSTASHASHSDLLAQARRQREQREQDRKRDAAARVIQAFYRGRRSAYHTRQGFRTQFDALVVPSSTPTSDSLLLASRLLAVLYVRGNTGDIKRAGAWCRAVLRPAENGDKTPLLFALFSTSSWTPLVRRIGSSILFAEAVSSPSLPQAPLFLELVKMLCDPTSYLKYRAAATSGASGEGVPKLLLALLKEGRFYERLRALIEAVPAATRTHPALPASIALSILPLKAYPAPPPSTASAPASPPPSPDRLLVLRSFTLAILSIPGISARVAAKEVTLLSAQLPFVDILYALSSPSSGLDALDPPSAANLLANLFCVPSAPGAGTSAQLRLVSHVKDGKTLRLYLDVADQLLQHAGRGVLTGMAKQDEDAEASTGGKGKGKAVEEIVIEDSDEENVEGGSEAVDRAREAVSGGKDNSGDTPMRSSSSTAAPVPSPVPTLDPTTLALLSTLTSRTHLLALLTLSSRFPTSTRPALASYLSTLLALLSAPSLTLARAEVLNTLLYAPGAAGVGLIRELWRGYVRASPLGRFLGQAKGRADSGAVLAAMGDAKYAQASKDGAGEKEWAALVLVVELYSRCLVTLGDDEFYASAAGPTAGESRNPLTLDEVTALSSMARNVAFALYWLGGEEDGVLEKKVVGTEWTYEEVRGLLTRFLGEVHARDSRRRFTPEGHWHMTDQFELASFVQTAVYEDERLSAEAAESGEAPPATVNAMDEDEDDDAAFPPSRRRAVQARATTARQAALSKRQMALVSPRLGVLNNIPFVIPFSTRVAIFRQFVSSDFQKLGLDASTGFIRRARHRAVVRRDHLAEDAYTHLNGLGPELKKRVEIVFVDEHGMEESGIDGGGLFKELLTSLSKEVFDTNRGLWLSTSQNELYPNPHQYAKDSNSLSWYTFIGRILGKALYEGILVNVRFADFFLAKWLGRQSYLDDLRSLDPELYAGLIKLKNYPGDVEDLSLTFAITEEDFGVSRTIDLIPGGSDVAVTSDNRMQYIVLVSHYRLNVQIAQQCRAFFTGLSEIIEPRWLRMFNQSELAVLVGGTEEGVDVEDLRKNTVYSGWPADENTPTIRAFWEVVSSFSKEDRAKLVRFVTACERPPLLGFAQLNPLFAIRNAGADEERLPTSATCVNLLKLPEYTNPDNLREKLLYAINSGAGFDLS